VAGQGTQREIADRWGIDRSTVVHIVKLAKQGALERLATSRPGRPGKSAAELALEDAQAEIERLRATVTEQAVELHLFRGKGSLGLTAGPVPARVDAGIKHGLLGLVDHAVAHGWSARRACEVLEVNDRSRVSLAAAPGGRASLEDAPPGPAEALHGLLDWERDAIVELFDDLGRDRPFAPQARAPRLTARQGVRVRIDRSAGATGREPGPARPSAATPAGPKAPWPRGWSTGPARSGPRLHRVHARGP
jgi:hypothetical protein